MTEGQVKSAYVLNFIKFVEWPPGAIGPDNKITLCVIGNPAYGAAFAALDGRKAGIHELHVMQRDPGGNLGNCHALFIGEAVPER